MGKFNLTNVIKITLFILGAVILAALISRVGLGEIVKTISGAKIGFLIAGFSVFLLLILIRALKWFSLIRIIQSKIRFGEFLKFYFLNCLLGNVSPFKSGEAASALIFKKYLKIPVGQGFSVIMLDRFFELIIFTAVFALSIVYLINTGAAQGLILSIFRWALAALFLLISVFIVVIASKKTSLRILRFFDPIKKFSLMEKILDFAERELQIFYEGMTLFKNKKVYRFLMPLTLICWGLELFSFYLIINSVLPASFLNTAAAQLTAIAATLLTFIPLGTGEAGAVYILKLFNHPEDLSLGGVLLVRIFLTGTLFIVGIIGAFLLREKKGISF